MYEKLMINTPLHAHMNGYNLICEHFELHI